MRLGILLTISSISAQQGGSLPPIDPASNTEAEAFGTAAANIGGDSSLGNAISNGNVNIYYGPGSVSISLPGPNPYGPNDVIIIGQGLSPSGKVLAIWHEWFHLEDDDHPTDPDDPETTPEKKKEWACDEAEAHCDVLIQDGLRSD